MVPSEATATAEGVLNEAAAPVPSLEPAVACPASVVTELFAPTTPPRLPTRFVKPDPSPLNLPVPVISISPRVVTVDAIIDDMNSWGAVTVDVRIDDMNSWGAVTVDVRIDDMNS
jgi:hypothetical protein